jgi:hypothetical protein
VAIKEVLLKNLPSRYISDLHMEMNILSQLKHDSIVELSAVYSTPEKKFLVRLE